MPLSQALPALKRTRLWNSPPEKKEKHCLLGDDFKFPISSKVKKCVEEKTPLDDNLRRQLIRECVTCLQAYVGDSLTSEHVTEASKKLCKVVPLLKDEKPPLWPEDLEFQYWVNLTYFVPIC